MSSNEMLWIGVGAAVLFYLNAKKRIRPNSATGIAGGGGGYQPPPPLNGRRGRNPQPPPPDNPPWHQPDDVDLSWMQPSS